MDQIVKINENASKLGKTNFSDSNRPPAEKAFSENKNAQKDPTDLTYKLQTNVDKKYNIDPNCKNGPKNEASASQSYNELSTKKKLSMEKKQDMIQTAFLAAEINDIGDFLDNKKFDHKIEKSFD